MQTDSEYPTPAEEALERLHKDLAAHRAALKEAQNRVRAFIDKNDQWHGQLPSEVAREMLGPILDL